MLFRCQTCIRSFCEDCLPKGELKAIGGSLPELWDIVISYSSSRKSLTAVISTFPSLLCDYGEIPQAYFIQCHHCVEEFATDEAVRDNWAEEEMLTMKYLREKEAVEGNVRGVEYA